MQNHHLTLINPAFQVVLITPAIAHEWLGYNRNNRKVSSATVARYTADMVAGRWAFTADPIRFDVNGDLIDGQHRLQAIASLPEGHDGIEMLVVTKLATGSQMMMDQGLQRKTGDQLFIAGFRDTAVVAAGVKLYLVHESGLLFRDNKTVNAVVTKARIVEWAGDNEHTIEAASSVPNIRASDATPSVAYCFALMSVQLRGVEWATEFFRLLKVGAGEGHPINALDKRLQRSRRERVKVSQREMLAWFLTAANAWTDGKSMTKLQTPRGGQWKPDNYPTLRAIVA